MRFIKKEGSPSNDGNELTLSVLKANTLDVCKETSPPKNMLQRLNPWLKLWSRRCSLGILGTLGMISYAPGDEPFWTKAPPYVAALIKNDDDEIWINILIVE